jgi:hypothetical protein
MAQAILWLCGRILARFYLALHRRAVVARLHALMVVASCPVKNEDDACSTVNRAGIPPLARPEEQAHIVNGADLCSVSSVFLKV